MATLDELHEEWLQNPKYSAAYEESGLCLEPGMGCTSCAWPRGLTQTELARRASVSPGTIARIELGDISARLSTVNRICHALGAETILGIPDRSAA
jgi:hypothetical protein